MAKKKPEKDRRFDLRTREGRATSRRVPAWRTAASTGSALHSSVRQAKARSARKRDGVSDQRAVWLLENLKRELEAAHAESISRINYLIQKLNHRS